MATVEMLESQIATLGEADFKRLAAWFHEFEKGFEQNQISLMLHSIIPPLARQSAHHV